MKLSFHGNAGQVESSQPAIKIIKRVQLAKPIWKKTFFNNIVTPYPLFENTLPAMGVSFPIFLIFCNSEHSFAWLCVKEIEQAGVELSLTQQTFNCD